VNPAKQPASADVIRRHADRLVDEFPDDSLETIAADLEIEASDTYEDGAFETALAVAAELRRRAITGVRKWTRPKRR
jgi:hypothetical protein